MLLSWTQGESSPRRCLRVAEEGMRPRWIFERLSSVFTSELVAISKELCYVEVGTEDLHLILTDSLSSLIALTRA